MLLWIKSLPSPHLPIFFSHLEVQRQTSLAIGIEFPFDVDCVKIADLDRSFKKDIHLLLFIPSELTLVEQDLHRGNLGGRVAVIGGTKVTLKGLVLIWSQTDSLEIEITENTIGHLAATLDGQMDMMQRLCQVCLASDP